MKVIKEGKVHRVTEKAYKIIYKERGYKPYKADNQENSQGQKETDSSSLIEGLESKTVEELIIMAKELGLKGYSNMSKDELIDLLAGA